MLDLSMWGLVIVFFCLYRLFVGPLFIRGIARIGQIFERSLQSFTWQDLFVAILGLIVGLIVANLLAMPLSAIPNLGFLFGYFAKHNFGIHRFDHLFKEKRRNREHVVLLRGL